MDKVDSSVVRVNKLDNSVDKPDSHLGKLDMLGPLETLDKVDKLDKRLDDLSRNLEDNSVHRSKNQVGLYEDDHQGSNKDQVVQDSHKPGNKKQPSSLLSNNWPNTMSR